MATCGTLPMLIRSHADPLDVPYGDAYDVEIVDYH
jgi:hypothetical protein